MQWLHKNFKFSYKKMDRWLFLMKRNDIVALQYTFLQQMCTLQENKDDCSIVYLNEMWVNQNYARTLNWQNKTNFVGLKVKTG